jgi:hypothetical protein
MRTTRTTCALLTVLALALLTGIGLVSCSEEPVNVDPQEVLATTSANMKELEGFHFRYELHQPESADRAEGVQSVDGDIDAAGSMQATVQLLAGGTLINVDFIALSDTHYLKYPISPNWVPLEPEESPLGDLNLAAFSIRILDQILGPTMVGAEKREGRRTFHITGQVTAQDVEAIAGSVSTADLFLTDLWVGIEDSRLYEVNISGPMTTKEPGGTWRSIILSDLDVVVEIKAPQ